MKSYVFHLQLILACFILLAANINLFPSDFSLFGILMENVLNYIQFSTLLYRVLNYSLIVLWILPSIKVVYYRGRKCLCILYILNLPCHFNIAPCKQQEFNKCLLIMSLRYLSIPPNFSQIWGIKVTITSTESFLEIF